MNELQKIRQELSEFFSELIDKETHQRIITLNNAMDRQIIKASIAAEAIDYEDYREYSNATDNASICLEELSKLTRVCREYRNHLEEIDTTIYECRLIFEKYDNVKVKDQVKWKDKNYSCPKEFYKNLSENLPVALKSINATIEELLKDINRLMVQVCIEKDISNVRLLHDYVVPNAKHLIKKLRLCHLDLDKGTDKLCTFFYEDEE